MENKKGTWNAHRFDVVAVSDEFLALLKNFPEFSTSLWVEVRGKRIEGPKQVLVARSMEEVEGALPGIVAQLADPQHQHIRVIHRQGICNLCAGSDNPCVHLGVNIPSMNEVFDLDASRFVVA